MVLSSSVSNINRMPMAAICSVAIHIDLVRPRAQPVTRCMKDAFPIKKMSCCFLPFNPQRRWHILPDSRKLCLKRLTCQQCEAHYMDFKRSHQLYRKLWPVPPLVVYGMDRNPSSASRNVSQIIKSCPESNDSLPDSIAGQSKALDSFFTKLHGDINELPFSPLNESDFRSAANMEEHQRSMLGLDKTNTTKIKSELGSLDNYFDKLSTYGGTSKFESKLSRELLETSSRKRKFVNEENKEEGQTLLRSLNGFAPMNRVKDDTNSVSFDDSTYEETQTDDSSDFYLINLFAAINIAVFLFEIASPIRDSYFEQLSLPLLYGAKVNKLILDGEWWRLVTPMFLHSGFLHVALSCWVLLTFGPQVCRAYGPFAFFLMYLMGGICANMTSFIHTPELTVSGTGPIFAIIGAWLVYQLQNKEAISKEVSDNMYRQAVVATVLSFFLADSAQIDEWTHLAAAISGVLYGFFTCPNMQLNDSSPEKNQKEGATIARHQADPLKSALTFITFVLALCPLVYLFVPDLDISVLDSFLE